MIVSPELCLFPTHDLDVEKCDDLSEQKNCLHLGPWQEDQLAAYVNIFRILALAVSGLNLFILAATHFTLLHAPFQSTFGLRGEKKDTRIFEIWMLATFILSLANLLLDVLVEYSIILNVIFILTNSVLTTGIITMAIRFTHSYPHVLWCATNTSGNMRYVTHPECGTWLTTVWVMMKSSFWLAIVLSIIYAVLLIFQSAAIYAAIQRLSRSTRKGPIHLQLV